MSTAVAALLQWDDRPVNPAVMQAANACVRYRCPDGAWSWVNGNIGLAQADLATLPEDTPGNPVATPEHRIAASCRLDNREELYRTLPAHLRPRENNDSALILAAYQAWGTACVDHLIGDFAFVIWDESEQRLFAARDLCGARPLYYYADQERLFLASEHLQILQDSTIALEIDDEQIVEFLTPSYQWTSGWNLGLFMGFRALPAGHCLTAHAGDIQLRPFWSWETQTLDARPEETLIEEYLALLQQSIQCRLRSRDAVAMELSGGLDSTALVCLVARLPAESRPPLHSTSMVFETVPETDERPNIEEILGSLPVGRVTSHFIDSSTYFSPHCFDVSWQPKSIPELQNMLSTTAHAHLAQSAWQAGCCVVISGEMGDTLNDGYEHVTFDLLRRGRWLETSRRFKLAWEHSPRRRTLRDFVGYGLLPFAPWPLLSRFLSWSEKHEIDEPGLAPFFAPDFAQRILDRDLTLRQQRLSNRSVSSPAIRALLQDFLPPMPSLGMPQAYPLEYRYPYADRRLLEFVLRMPPETKWQADEIGYFAASRYHHRRALRGIMPDSVRCGNLGVYFDPAIENSLSSGKLMAWLKQDSTIHVFERGYVDPDRFLNCLNSQEEMSGYISTMLCLEAWLRALAPGGKMQQLIPAYHQGIVA